MTIDRRTLIASAGGFALGLAGIGNSSARPDNARKRFAIVGLGSRARMYQGAITGKYRDNHELVALCDINPGRLALAMRNAASAGTRPKTYAAVDFDHMLAESKPDVER
jgi:predicted dehydrogenase